MYSNLLNCSSLMLTNITQTLGGISNASTLIANYTPARPTGDDDITFDEIKDYLLNFKDENSDITKKECGTGFTLKTGDVHGWGESIGSFPEIKTSDTCAFLCSVIYAQYCCSYEWSPTELKCNLNKECHTQTRTNHKDYLFCRRDNIKDLAGSQN